MTNHGRWAGRLVGLAAVAGLALAVGCGSEHAPPAPTAAIPTSKSAAPVSVADDPELAEKAKRAASRENRLHPKVVLDTSMGEVVVQLDAEKAPLTAENFLAYVHAGHYDQTIFHQVVQGRAVFGGYVDTNRVEKRTRVPVSNEAHNRLKNVRGTIAMVRRPDVIDSATSQFFFNLGDNDWLDHKDRSAKGYGYCVFGKVIAGLDVLDKIAAVPVHDQPPYVQIPKQAVLIKSARQVY